MNTLTADDSLARIRSCGAVAIIRSRTEAEARHRAGRVLAAGMPVVEVSLTTPGALRVIAELAETPDCLIGAGTVRTAKEATEVVRAGARLIVCPTTAPEVIAVARDHDIAVLPGCLTPTEMSTAMSLGATAVKVFPANLWSPDALDGLLQAMPELPCVPTGGIGPDNAAPWIAAGAVAVGVGSSLTSAADPEAVVGSLLATLAIARGSRG